MKPRHAAALALVGWYLMAPGAQYLPAGSKDADGKPIQGWALSDEGISDWSVVAAYDTAKECEAQLKNLLKNGLVSKDEHTDDPENKARAQAEAAKRAQCIATDDPRLKGN